MLDTYSFTQLNATDSITSTNYITLSYISIN